MIPKIIKPRGESIDDVFEMVHISDEREEQKWKGKKFVYIPQLHPDYREERIDFNAFCEAIKNR